MKRVLPSLTSSAIPPTLSSIGTLGSTRDMQKTSERLDFEIFQALLAGLTQVTRGSPPPRTRTSLARSRPKSTLPASNPFRVCGGACLPIGKPPSVGGARRARFGS